MYILKLSDGRELCYTTFGVRNPGPGKTLIYQHGFMSGRMEAKILEPRAVSLGIRIISVDRPGYGFSTHDPSRTPRSVAKDIEELLDALLTPEEKVVFYGVSGGAAYAAACAAILPHRTEGLLLSVPFATLGGGVTLSSGMSKRGLSVIMGIRERPWRTKFTLVLGSILQRTPFRRILLHLGGFAKIDIETHKRYPDLGLALNMAGREGSKKGLKGQFRDLEVMSDYPFEAEALSKVTCKAVVWAGELDVTTPIGMAQAYAQALPNSRLHIVPDMGHFLGMKHGFEVLKSIYA